MATTEPTSPRSRRFVVRWAIATAVVAGAALGGFALRAESSRRTRTPAEARRTVDADPRSAGSIFAGLPTISDALSPAGEAAAADGSAVDFRACDAAPAADAAAGATPASWVPYRSVLAEAGSVEFRHPSDWDVVEDGDRIRISSPDGIHVTVLTVPLGKGRIPSLSAVFEQAASEVPAIELNDVRAISVGGHQACHAKARADGQSGELMVVDGGSLVAVIVATYESDMPAELARQAGAVMTSIRLES